MLFLIYFIFKQMLNSMINKLIRIIKKYFSIRKDIHKSARDTLRTLGLYNVEDHRRKLQYQQYDRHDVSLLAEQYHHKDQRDIRHSRENTGKSRERHLHSVNHNVIPAARRKHYHEVRYDIYQQ